MRKQTKIVAVASAAALLAIGASMTAFAAQGWVEEDGIWYYYDRDGARVEDEWKRSGDNWYWLDSEEGGAMAVDKLIEDDDDTYYVDTNGVMVRNTWVKVVNEDQDEDDDPAEYNYYYMQSNGKAYKNSGNSGLSKKTIDGKKYAFDEDGKMLYGWVDDNGDMQNGEDDWMNALYYFGNWDDGAMKTGWQQIYVHDPAADKDDDYYYWFNFRANGRVRKMTDPDDTWKSNGKYYHFDENGVMVYQWFETGSGSNTSTSNWSYFNSPEDGARVTKGWFKVIPPTEDNSYNEDDDTFALDDSRDESERWYYSDGDGEVVSGEIRKIKGKYYGFYPEGLHGGRMLTGLCALEMDGDKILTVLDDNMDADDLDDFMNSEGDYEALNDIAGHSQKDSNVYLYYFGNDDDADMDGAMKTGNVTINLDGDTYQFYFKKSGGAESRGRGLNGHDDEKYVYHYGLKVKADSDDRYAVVVASGDINDETAVVKVYDLSDIRKNEDLDHKLHKSEYDGEDGTVKVTSDFPDRDHNHWYLVNSSGRIQDGTKTGVKDGNEWYWYLHDDDIIMYTDSKKIGLDKDVATANGVDQTVSLKTRWKEAGMTSANLTTSGIIGLTDALDN